MRMRTDDRIRSRTSGVTPMDTMTRPLTAVPVLTIDILRHISRTCYNHNYASSSLYRADMARCARIC